MNASFKSLHRFQYMHYQEIALVRDVELEIYCSVERQLSGWGYRFLLVLEMLLNIVIFLS